MQSKATTVDEYLAGLPEDRRDAIQRVRDVVLKNLDKDYEEGMQYGMIGYYVPHRVFPAGYHCDPKQPLSFAGLASQKNHMSLYVMCIYGHAPLREWFEKEWAKTGKKLDMGKACIRFKKIEDLPLEVIGEAIRRVPVSKYLAQYTKLLQSMGKGSAKKATKKNSVAKSAKVAKGKKPAKSKR